MGVTSIKDFVAAWNLPGWGILLVLVATIIKTWPIIQRNLLDARERRESRYSTRISELEEMVRQCQQECEDHKEELRNEIHKLEMERLGDKRQHVQEQISLVAVLVENIDNPILKQILSQLQNVQRSLPEKVRELTGVVGDAAKTP
jgi:acyl-CoA reductase-like NAD-dependent aldehyde dehydrogenase